MTMKSPSLNVPLLPSGIVGAARAASCPRIASPSLRVSSSVLQWVQTTRWVSPGTWSSIGALHTGHASAFALISLSLGGGPTSPPRRRSSASSTCAPA